MRKQLQWCSAVVLLAFTSLAAAQPEAPEEIIVVAKYPGPALWKVSNGDHVLWIFGSLPLIPENMIWESARVEDVIAEADEFIELEGFRLSFSMLTRLKPANVRRRAELTRLLTENASGKSLQEALPPELYQRFAALRAQYAPENHALETMRPWLAANTLEALVVRNSGLVSGEQVTRRIDRLVRRNWGIKKTVIESDPGLDDDYDKYADRMETMLAEFQYAQELACVEFKIANMETDIERLRSNAADWARGDVSAWERTAVGFWSTAASNPCPSTAEARLADKAEPAVSLAFEQWVAAAEEALANNATSFAVLNMDLLVNEGAILARLKNKGYEVRSP